MLSLGVLQTVTGERYGNDDVSTDLNSLRATAFWLGGLVTLSWAWRDLHRGLPENEVRFATPRDRYFLGSFAFSAGMLILYFLAAQTTIATFALPPSLLATNVFGETPVSLVAVFVVTTLLPEMPILRSTVDAFRDLCRLLALYPQAANRFTRLLRWQAVGREPVARSALSSNLSKYEVQADELERLVSGGTLHDLYEIQFVRDSLNAIVHSGRRWSRLNGFVGARDQSLCACEEMYQGLLSQIARVCALADGFVSDRDHPYPLAGPIVRGSNELLARYRRLISEAALSCFSGGKARRDFVAGFGYVSPPDWLLPYWPLLAIFVLDIALFVIPITFHLVPGGDFITIEPMLLFLLGHALLQLVSIGWAVFPKARSNFARPSLSSYPWISYVVFGVCSAATAVLVMWINTAALNFVTHGGLPKLNGLSH